MVGSFLVLVFCTLPLPKSLWIFNLMCILGMLYGTAGHGWEESNVGSF